MCRNIKPLFNFKPRATDKEIELASLQFVRKISGFTVPSRVNERAFRQAEKEIARSAKKLLFSMRTDARPKNRQEETEKAKERAKARFG